MKVKLLASLSELVGKRELIIDNEKICDTIKELVEKYNELKSILDPESCRPKPGYIIFVDGKDIRLLDNNEKGKEMIILAVNHGGEGPAIEKVSWTHISELVEIVSDKIIKSGFKPDVIIGILRGGIIPARLIADVLGVNEMGVIEIKLYEGVGVKGERPFVRQPLVYPVIGKRVLIVDDISDSGLTLQAALSAVDLAFPKIVKTATLYIKPWTNLIPDFYGEITENWIVFPWELYEFERESE